MGNCFDGLAGTATGLTAKSFNMVIQARHCTPSHWEPGEGPHHACQALLMYFALCFVLSMATAVCKWARCFKAAWHYYTLVVDEVAYWGSFKAREGPVIPWISLRPLETQLDTGNFLLLSCTPPARILEISREGEDADVEATLPLAVIRQYPLEGYVVFRSQVSPGDDNRAMQIPATGGDARGLYGICEGKQDVLLKPGKPWWRTQPSALVHANIFSIPRLDLSIMTLLTRQISTVCI